MNCARSAAKFLFSCAAPFLVACGMSPSALQDKQMFSSSGVAADSSGVVDDWTHHHVIFSNPGTMEDAINNDSYEKWRSIVTDPRYRMQWIKRYGASSEEAERDRFRLPRGPRRREPSLWKIDSGYWSVQIAGGSNSATAIDMYPAKFTFSVTGAPSCTDFVVFPISGAGQASQQGNIVGLNNLYSGTCSSNPPSWLFNYFVGTGTVQTSPVLSENGAKVAFVESITGGSRFHVVTIGTTGTNGSAFNSPVAPCTVNGTNSCSTNNAVDNYIVMSGGVSVTRSSPFVDYTNDIAYVGDDSGKLHKFTPVFQGTPAEVTTGGWPFTVAAGIILTGPVYDGGTSTHIFVGGSNGDLYCVTTAPAHCTTSSVPVTTGTPGAILDAPIVDSTNERVFAEASNATNSYLMQATTALGTVRRASMGVKGTDLYNGMFDNAYFTSVGTGHMYFCGNLTTAATPTLWRVGFASSGAMDTTNDGNSLQLVQSGHTGTANDCTPLTEIYNGTTDYLFVGVKDNGNPAGCNGNTCIMSFVITSSFPSSANAVTTQGLGAAGTSGMVIDNVSGTTGASQIYFGDLQLNTAVQASQSGLN